MPLGMEVGLSLGNIVLDGTSSPSPKGARPPIFGQCPFGQTAGWIKMPLGTEVNLGPDDVVSDGGTTLQFSIHVYCGQTAVWMKTPLSTEVHLVPGHIVLEGTQFPAKGAQQPPLFGPCLVWQWSPILATAELL